MYASPVCCDRSVSEVIDEIYENVMDVEPWMSGNARGPSTAFNLLHRLCTLKPSIRDVKEMLDHHDSVYIRAVRSRSTRSAV